MNTPRRARRPVGLVLVALGAALLLTGVPELRTSRNTPQVPLVLVTKVVDGDTIDVLDGLERIRVRLKCVDTPETVHPRRPVEFYGPEASAYTKKALTGKWVHLESDPEDRWDRYGRLLAYVFPGDGSVFNLELLREGYARTTRYPCLFKREATAAEQEARAAGRGIWSTPTTHDPAPVDVGGPIIGNRRSHVYHLPSQRTGASVSERYRVYFQTEAEARAEGYQRASR